MRGSHSWASPWGGEHVKERVGRLGALQAHLGRIGVALKQRQLDFNQKLEAIRTANGS